MRFIKSALVLVGLFGLFIVFSGCEEDFSFECERDSDCGPGFTCDSHDCVQTCDAGYPIEFPDSNVELAVRRALDMSNGDIEYEDIRDVTILDISSSNIADLRGIHCFSSLEELDASGNALRSISPLQDMVTLTVFNLDQNRFNGSHASMLFNNLDTSMMVNLRLLSLRSNAINHLGINENLQSDAVLDLRGNPIDCDSTAVKRDRQIYEMRDIELRLDCP